MLKEIRINRDGVSSVITATNSESLGELKLEKIFKKHASAFENK